jgi:hypothetical protein
MYIPAIRLDEQNRLPSLSQVSSVDDPSDGLSRPKEITRQSLFDGTVLYSSSVCDRSGMACWSSTLVRHDLDPESDQ